jgi:hypothetical protein
MAVANLAMAVLHGPARPIPLPLLLHRLREPPRRRIAIAHRQLS